MTDLSKTIAPKSDQLNADDLIAGPMTIEVTKVQGNENADQPISVFFKGDSGKPYKPCKSMRRVLVTVWGPDGAKYPGRTMTLYNDPEVMFGGIKVGGIRISHMSHIENTKSMMLTATRARRKEYVVKPLTADQAEEALIRAREAAGEGTEAFRTFWNSEFGKNNRDNLKEHLSDLQDIATKADESAKPLSQRIQEEDQPQNDEPDPNELEYAEGRTAAQNGATVADCPYKDDPHKMKNWIAGHKDGSDG